MVEWWSRSFIIYDFFDIDLSASTITIGSYDNFLDSVIEDYALKG
jgi:hypothetical protein